MRLELDLNATPLRGILRHSASEHAFDFTPMAREDLTTRTGLEGTTSIGVGTLQLELGIDTGLVLFAWGYSPRTSWHEDTLQRPHLKHGTVRVTPASNLKAGVAIDLPEAKHWAVTRDPNTGWIFFGAAPTSTDVIEVATGVGLAITDGVLHGVWLHPTLDI